MYDYAISIIIPTYKPGDYIYECLFSIQNQSFSKKLFEILIILNGDKEPYYTDIKHFIKNELTAYHVQLIYSAEKGVSNARNVGIEKSKGKYLAFVDDDDIISEKYLYEMYDVVKENIMPLSYWKVFKDDITENTNGYITNLYDKRLGKKICILNVRSYFSIACAKLIDRDIINNQRFNVNFQNGEDSLFMFSISNKIKKVQFSKKNSVYYRRVREGSLTTNPYTIRNCFMRIAAYTMIWIKNPFEYNFLFFITRILASLRGLIWNRDRS
ncbi:putative Poly(ribitol-phosphate) beta-glucosyltransferase [Hollandina sp. SP2]